MLVTMRVGGFCLYRATASERDKAVLAALRCV
jgi:hypothetical protein